MRCAQPRPYRDPRVVATCLYRDFDAEIRDGRGRTRAALSAQWMLANASSLWQPVGAPRCWTNLGWTWMFFRAIRLPRFKPLLREAPRGHCFGTQKSAARAVAQLIRCAAFAGSPVPYSRFRFCAPHPSSSAGLGSRAPCFWHTCPQLHQSGDIITRRIRVRSSSAGVRCGTPMEHNAAAVLPHSGRSLQAWGFIGASRVGSGASFLYTAGVRMNVVTSGTIGNPHDPPGTASLCQTNSEWIGAHVPNTCAVTVAMPVFAPQAICPLENS